MKLATELRIVAVVGVCLAVCGGFTYRWWRATPDAVLKRSLAQCAGPEASIAAVRARALVGAQDAAGREKLAHRLRRVALDEKAPMPARSMACELMLVTGTGTNLLSLAALLGQTNATLQVQARRLFEQSPYPEAETLLLERATKARTMEQANSLLTALGTRRSAAAVPLMARRMHSPTPEVRLAAVNALAMVGSVVSMEVLYDGWLSRTNDMLTADALLRGVDRLPEADRSRAVKPVRRIYAASHGAIRSRALLALCRLEAPATVLPLLTACLISLDLQEHEGALAAFAGEPALRTDAVAAAMIDFFPRLGAGDQKKLLEAFRVRGDRSAVPLARAVLMASPHDAVRAAAVRILADQRDLVSLPALLAWSRLFAPRPDGVKPDETRIAAREALAVLPGPGVDQLLVQRFAEAAPPARARMIRLLAVRGSDAVTSCLLDPVVGGDVGCREAAGEAVRAATSPADFQRVFAFARTAQPAYRETLLAALGDVARRCATPEEPARIVCAAFANAGTGERIGLLDLLACIPCGASLAKVSDMLDTEEPALRLAAIRTLGRWNSFAAVEVLKPLALSSVRDAGERRLAMQAIAAVIIRPGVLKTPEEGADVLRALVRADLRSDAVAIIRPVLTDSALDCAAARRLLHEIETAAAEGKAATP